MTHEIAGEIRKLRKARAWTQKDLGQRMGVGGARVSQLEGTSDEELKKAEDDVLLRLAAALGDNILRVAQWGPYGELRSYRSDALVALWRIRIDVLRSPVVFDRPSARRSRASRLADELEAVACRTVEANFHVRNGRLVSLEDITPGMPPVALRLLAAEAITMMIDAPLDLLRTNEAQSLPWEAAREQTRARGAVVDMLESSCRLDAHEARRWLEGGPRPLWKWDELACAGGPLGQLHALSSGDQSVLLLKGHEPSGWMGWDMVAGAWQVRTPSDDDKVGDDVARRGGNLATADRLWIPPVQRLSITDGVVNRLTRGVQGSRDPQEDLQHPDAPGPLRLGDRAEPSMSWLAHVEPDLQGRLITARALGKHWVRQHANRVVAFYKGFEESAEGDGDERLPTADAARETLQRLADAAYIAKELEHREVADIGDGVERQWTDLHKTWSAAAAKMR